MDPGEVHTPSMPESRVRHACQRSTPAPQTSRHDSMTRVKSGLDLSHLDPAVRPQDDLFRYLNGAWLTHAEIPADKARFGEFIRLRDDAERHLHAIVEELRARTWPSGTDEQRIAHLYDDFMDTERIESLGAAPLHPLLARVAEVDSPAALTRLVGELERTGVPGLFSSYVTTDQGDSTRYRVYLGQGGLGLPDESYYRDDRFVEVRADYVQHVGRMLALAGAGDHESAHQVMEVETRLATAHWDRVATRDAVKTYNPTTRAALGELAPAVPWQQWLEALGGVGHELDDVVVRQPDFFAALSRELEGIHLDSWRTWLRWKVVHRAAPYLSEPFVAENFDFYGRTLSGTQQIRERWKRGVSVVESNLGDALGRVYVERHFPPAAKQRMDTLVAHLLEAYRRRIGALEWMSPGTRERALHKLDAFTPKIGYPDTWRAAVLRPRRRRRRELRGHRRGDRARDRSRLRRPGLAVRRPGKPRELVGGRRPGRVRRTCRHADRAVRHLRAGRHAGAPRERRADRRREHR